MKLHSPKRADGTRDMYCGPAALCAISGWTYEEVRSEVNGVRRRKYNQGITGMHNHEMKKALWSMGFVMEQVNCYRLYDENNKQFTLNQFLKPRPKSDKTRTMLINVTGHYVTVQGDKLVDNHTGNPVHIAIAPWKRKKVQQVWFVRPRTYEDLR